MKTRRSWENPKPSLFRKTPPEIVALDQRKRAAEEARARRQARFLEGVVNGLGGISLLVVAAAIATAAAVWRH
jgi:hypothetical protein